MRNEYVEKAKRGMNYVSRKVQTRSPEEESARECVELECGLQQGVKKINE